MGKKKKKRNKRTTVTQRGSKNYLADVSLAQEECKTTVSPPLKQTSKAHSKRPKKHISLNCTGKCFSFIRFLMEPSKIFAEKQTQVKAILIVITTLLTGFALNDKWVFPNFTFYVVLFSLILTVTYFSLSYFYHNMDILHAEVTGLSPFDKSEYFYIQKTASSSFYVIFPVCIIVTFGVGGSVIYGAISFTPTFIWCLLYFTVVVYFSMLAYSQYIRFTIYLYMAAHNEQQFENMIMPDKKELPPKLSWMVCITKISRVLNLMFFVVGGLYILAFATFCFSPVYHVKIGAGLFYALWMIIFVLIVLAFPIIYCQKAADIKLLIAKTKHCYIREILLENQLHQSPANDMGRLSIIMRNYCISIVLNAPDYPTNGKVTAFFSAIGIIINFAASIATVLEYQGIHLFNF